MAQSSGPISQGTTAERQFTDVQWRDLFGDEPGVIGDMDGTAYGITLGPSADTISVGSATQRSLARVAGFQHAIPTGSPENLTIPAASGSTRTDLVALRYDPAYTGALGPVRLVRIAGVSAAVPAYDATPPGIEELPLFAITRAVGGAIAAATVVRQFPRIAPVLEVPVGVTLPTSSPLGTIVKQGTVTYTRKLNPTVAAWVQDVVTPPIGTRNHTPISTFIPSGNFRESGVADGPVMSGFTLPFAATVLFIAHFRCGQNVAGTGAALPSFKVDGVTRADGVARWTDSTLTLHAAVALAAGAHTWSVRIDAFGGDCAWVNARISYIAGGPE